MKRFVFVLCGLCLLGCAPAAFGQKSKTQSLQPNAVAASAEKPLTDVAAMSLEAQVLQEINALRSNPAAYVKLLEEHRQHYVGNQLQLLNETAIVTNEGVNAVDEAIAYLKTLKPTTNLADVNGLNRAADAHLQDLIKNNRRGHFGSDGSSPEARVQAFGAWGGEVKELISYSAPTARRMVLNWLIDDGVKSRGHRLALLKSNFRSIGIMTGKSSSQGQLCILVLTETFTAK